MVPTLDFIEKFCEEKGVKIAHVLMNAYDPAEFEINGAQIEGEIYDAALSYAKILFFEERAVLSDEIREFVRRLIIARFDAAERGVLKMEDADLIAHWIKSVATGSLENKGVVLV